jgi:hypothetical protein
MTHLSSYSSSIKFLYHPHTQKIHWKYLYQWWGYVHPRSDNPHSSLKSLLHISPISVTLKGIMQRNSLHQI